jgi:hypothetical protein
MNKTAAILCLWIFPFILPATGRGQEAVQIPLEKDKIFKNAYVLISESDLYCSFFVLEDIPAVKIAASEKGGEKSLLSDGDIFYIDRGLESGLAEGQMMTILEIGPAVSSPGAKKRFGPAAFKRGRARIVKLENGRFLARVEKACGEIRVGDSLVPFEEKEGILGNDLGYQASVQVDEAATGRIVFLDEQFVQIGPGQWALIDLGRDSGIQFGQQLTVFHEYGKGLPPEAVANVIVIDAGRFTSTIKVLSAKDAVKIGDLVQVK